MLVSQNVRGPRFTPPPFIASCFFTIWLSCLGARTQRAPIKMTSITFHLSKRKDFFCRLIWVLFYNFDARWRYWIFPQPKVSEKKMFNRYSTEAVRAQRERAGAKTSFSLLQTKKSILRSAPTRTLSFSLPDHIFISYESLEVGLAPKSGCLLQFKCCM